MNVQRGAFVLILAAIVTLFWARLGDLLHNGTSIAPFVLAVSCILLFLGVRQMPMTTSLSHGKGGLALLLGSLFAIVLEDAYKIPIVSTTPLLMAGCMAGVLGTLYGDAALRRERFPLLYLLLMTPVPVVLNVLIDVPLQIASAMLATSFVRALGVPAERYGTTVSMHNGELALRIIADCNGMRSGIAMVALAVLLGWLLRASPGKWIALVLAGVAVAYAANIARLTSLLLLLDKLGVRFEAILPRAEEWIGAVLFIASLGGLALVARGMGCVRFRAL